MQIIDDIQASHAEFTALRRDIHAHPELGFEETRTSTLVANKLREWGYEVTTGLGKTGVVGTLKRGNSPRSIGIRADMDALPMQEANTFGHHSSHPSRMHACGHDGHTTILLAAAKHLATHQNFDGTLHLIFQPAEESLGGGRAMVQDGLFERFPCDAIFGLHNWPGMPVGQIGIRPGPILASSNTFEIIISRNRNPIEAAVLSVTQIHTGDAVNIVPDHATLRGTVRTFSVEMIDLIETRMKALAESICSGFGAKVEFRFLRNYPPTINDPEQTAFVTQVLTDVIGADNIVSPIDPVMAAEDFSFMLLQRPGCYFFLGNGDGTHRADGHGDGPCLLHNPSYDFNDDAIPVGATLWVRLVEAFLHR